MDPKGSANAASPNYGACLLLVGKCGKHHHKVASVSGDCGEAAHTFVRPEARPYYGAVQCDAVLRRCSRAPAQAHSSLPKALLEISFHFEVHS